MARSTAPLQSSDRPSLVFEFILPAPPTFADGTASQDAPPLHLSAFSFESANATVHFNLMDRFGFSIRKAYCYIEEGPQDKVCGTGPGTGSGLCGKGSRKPRIAHMARCECYRRIVERRCYMGSKGIAEEKGHAQQAP